jgi:NADH-quinone oxidoreductase subunit A
VYFDFGNVLIFLLFGALFVIVALFLSRVIRPANPSAEKQSTYECGEIPLGGSWIQFNLRFYVIALVFLIFEVEVIFLFPWAVVLQQIGVYALVEMFIFIGILLVGFAYVWKKRDLDWILVHEVHVRKTATRTKVSDDSSPIDGRVTLPQESVPTT